MNPSPPACDTGALPDELTPQVPAFSDRTGFRRFSRLLHDARYPHRAGTLSRPAGLEPDSRHSTHDTRDSNPRPLRYGSVLHTPHHNPRYRYRLESPVLRHHNREPPFPTGAMCLYTISRGLVSGATPRRDFVCRAGLEPVSCRITTCRFTI